MKENITVVEYLINALKAINVHHVFGVPGDFAFPINDAICNSADIEWIGCCNELNASYAADGYARIHGIAALNTTYGPGELSALCGVAGAYSAHLPIIFIAGMPSEAVMNSGALMHHTLGDGKFDNFVKMAEHVVEAIAVLTLDNAIDEINRVIQLALHTKRPVYIALPEDVAIKTLENPIDFHFSFEPLPASNDVIDISELIALKINSSIKPLIMVGEHARVSDAIKNAEALIDTCNLPFSTMFADKSIIDETNSNFIGLCDGKVINKAVNDYVESSDFILNIGALFTDFNTGAFSITWPANMINVYSDYIEIDGEIIPPLNYNLLLEEITKRVTPRNDKYICHMGYENLEFHENLEVKKQDLITAESLYPTLESFFKEDDQIIAETGTISMGLGLAHLPKGAIFENQTLWGSIGWATPASFGASIANPHKRTILLTGEGSHQLTVQEIGQFHRFGLKPIIILLNNDGYLIERILCKDPMIVYNDLCQWNYSELPKAFGAKDWLCVRVTTNKELNEALEMANKANTGVYIEVVTGIMDASALAANLAGQLNPQRGLNVHVSPVQEK
ncbi:TPA: alpha-keto acid decarboxylase family protein [Photobacterium damselae]